MEKKKREVLLIDDSEETLQMVRQILENHAFTCTTAITAVEGLAKARKSRPDLILLDLMLPQMSGLGFVRELKADPLLSKIPVIILSGIGDEEVAREVLDLGASGYLRKTCGIRELVSTVANYLP
ncbi:MAG: response regulator [Deltaproteobacteria bacterium]|nr:response regulator [Deltaproteobacteria bacterium]MBI4374369.1 response regulator [Deltaproteobacteria bacterium]